MNKKRKVITSLLIASGILSSPLAARANDGSELEELRALVQELDQKVRVLARQNELSAEDAAARKKETPIVKASESGFGLESADGKFKFKLGAVLQGDARTFFDKGSTTTTDDLLLRRAEADFQATVYDKYDFRLLTEFAPNTAGILDAYVNARFTPGFKVQFGKFKAPASLERLQSAAALKFIDRTYVADALLPNRDIGLQLHGDLFDSKVSYAVGVFDGQVDGAADSTSNNKDNNTDKDFAGRLFFQPFKGSDSALAGLGFGISGSWADLRGTTTDTNLTSGYKTPGRLTFFKYAGSNSNSVYADGERIRWSPQGYYTNGPFYLLAEYARVSQDVTRVSGGIQHANLNHDAWQVAASWFLTGEDNSFGVVRPKRPFDLDTGGIGAWEVAARYSELNVDKDTFNGGANSFADPQVSAKSAKSVALGINWHLNSFVKFATTYERTKFDGGKKGAGTTVLDRDDENLLSARFQLAF